MAHMKESDYATSTQANYVSRINQVYRLFGREDITRVFGNPRDYGISRDRTDQTDPKVQKANPEQAINHFKAHMEQKGGFRAEALRIVTSLQKDLGLRLEESLKLKVTDKTIETAERTGKTRIEKTKGNRPRMVPVSEKALKALKEARDWQKEYKASANIPTSMSYQQMAKFVKNHYSSFKEEAGLDRFSPHGNRHAYAQERFIQLTGEQCPLASGRFGEDNLRAIAESRGVSMDEAREIDSQARADIAEQLGHGRDEITRTYLTRMLHESLTATTDMAVLPAVLGCRSLRRTIQVRLGTNTLRLSGGPPILVVS
jgi:integrase